MGELGPTAGPEAEAALVGALLEDKDAVVRRYAAQALGKWGTAAGEVNSRDRKIGYIKTGYVKEAKTRIL